MQVEAETDMYMMYYFLGIIAMSRQNERVMSLLPAKQSETYSLLG